MSFMTLVSQDNNSKMRNQIFIPVRPESGES